MCRADVDGEITAVPLSRLHRTRRANGTHPVYPQGTGSQDPTEGSPQGTVFWSGSDCRGSFQASNRGEVPDHGELCI